MTMNRRSLSILLSILTISSAYANHCGQSPEILKRLEKSTFQIVPINSYAANMEVERARELHEAHCKDESPLLHERLNCEVLKKCDSEKNCVRSFLPHGTAFLHKGEIHTAWHVVFGTHASALLFLQNHLSSLSKPELHEKLSVLKPEFLLFNTLGEKVFDTREHEGVVYLQFGDPLSTIYSNNGHKKKAPYGYYENIPGDFVTISVPMNLGPSFERGIEDACFNSVGFAYNGKKTQFKISSGEKSSITERQKHIHHLIPFQITRHDLSTEEFMALSEEESLKLMGFSDEQVAAQMKKYGREKIRESINTVYRTYHRHMRDQEMDQHSDVLVHTGDVFPGQSGGPLLNSKGEIVGITTNGFINTDEGLKKSVGGAGVRIKALD